MTAAGMCCTKPIFHPKSALEWERWKTKWWKLGTISDDLPFSISGPLTSLSCYLPTTSTLLSALPPARSPRCTCVGSISETINDGLCVRCKRWHWGRSQEPRVRQCHHSCSLGPRGANMSYGRRERRVQGQLEARGCVPQAPDTLRDWFVEGRRWGWTQGQTNAWVTTESTRGN